MSEDSINNLSDLLKPYLGPNKEIKDVEIKRLTAPGENFGSVMLKVDITVRKNDGTEEMLHTVAKKIPASEMFRKIFNIQVTFKNEMAFYTTVLPTLRNFQRECGVENVLDCFAEFYGARISLDADSTVVDDDAVLVLENLYASGYTNVDRFKQFNLAEAKVIIKDLANFHGVVLALRLKQPDVFEKNIKQFCRDFEPSQDFVTIGSESLKALLKEKEELVPIIPKLSRWGQYPVPATRGPFATITHYDLWVNNTMQLFENGKPIKNKFIDFQAYAYRSAASDLFFFIWTSIRTNTIQKHLDEIIEFYHEHLIETLKTYHCDVEELGYEKFLEDFNSEARLEFGHAVQFAIFVAHGVKGGPEMNKTPSVDYFVKTTSDKAKEKLYFMVAECDKRGWM